MGIGKRLKEARERKGLTQRELAKMVGVTGPAITNYENEVSHPKEQVMYALIDALGVDPNFLFQDCVDIGTKRAPSLSDRAIRIARTFDRLDDWGKRQVQAVADNELSRCTEQAAADEPPEIIYLNMPEFDQPMSAGTGQPTDDDMWHDLLLKKRPPRGTSYVARISGDSMEPTYRDGDRLFIRAAVDIRPGQVGVFLMDGQQWVKELGDGVLISHNPAYPPRPMTEDVRCQGLVLGVCDESYFS